MRLSLASAVALVLGVAAQPAAASNPPVEGSFKLARMARAASPGLHIKLVDSAGAPVYPIAILVEYDRGAPATAEATAAGATLPAEAGRIVRSITLGGQAPQRFEIQASGANFLLFKR